MKINQLILEYDRNITAQKLGQTLLAKFKKEPAQWQQRIVGNPEADDQTVINHLLGRVELADPTKNKQYVPWIIRMYTNSPSLKFEDAVSKVFDPLIKFFKLVQKKQIPAPNNDIGRVKDLATLVQLVDQFPDVEDKDKDADRGQAKAYYEDDQLRIIVPEDKTAACYYGQGTRWCTASTNNNMFDRYNKDGAMYIILPKKPAYTGEKYQFHFETKQFMDEKDHRVNLKELRARFPQLADIFAKQASANGIISLDKSMDAVQERMSEVLPLFRNTLRTMIIRDGQKTALEIAKEIGSASRAFSGLREEVVDMAEMMMEEDATKIALMVMNTIADNGLEIATNEDQLYDIVTDFVADIRSASELWLYVTEVLEDMDDEEGEFDCAMAIDGEVSSLLINLIPIALKEAMNAVQRSTNNSEEAK